MWPGCKYGRQGLSCGLGDEREEGEEGEGRGEGEEGKEWDKGVEVAERDASSVP